MIKHVLLAATLLASAGAAEAAPSYTFTGGASSPASGLSVIYDFDTTTPAITGSGFQIQSGTDGNGAAPAFANPGGKYLSVLGGGSATINFASPVDAFSFDWGSIDDYNSLNVMTSVGNVMLNGAMVSAANGNQSSSTTNGLFTFLGNGATISGFTLTSGSNSFEIDNVAAVPEPATWGMMILGFGVMGGAMRRRQRTTARVAMA